MFLVVKDITIPLAMSNALMGQPPRAEGTGAIHVPSAGAPMSVDPVAGAPFPKYAAVHVIDVAPEVGPPVKPKAGNA